MIIFGLLQLGLQTGLLAKNFGNLANAYHSYGLPYCFVNSIINTGIDRPKNYTSEVINTIIDTVEHGNTNPSEIVTPTVTITPSPVPTSIPSIAPEPEDEPLPNIIFLQLESFFDVTRINGVVTL